MAAKLKTSMELPIRTIHSIRRLGMLTLISLSVVFPLLFPNPAIITIAVFALLFAGAATGWNIFSGYTGYISLGHATFYGLGAYILALLCHVWNIPGGFPPLFLLPVVGLLTGLCSIPLGWIALKTRRFTFMVITIAVFVLTTQLPGLLSGIIAGVSEESLPIPLWSGDQFNLPFYYTALALLLLALGISWWVRYSKYGLMLLAIRDDEARAQGLGVRVGRCKLTAYLLSASIVGMAGALSAYFLGFVSPASAFDRSLNIAIPLMAFLGGSGTLWGPFLGALVVVPLQQFLTLQYGAQGWDLILYGLLFLLVIRALPEGILPTLQGRRAAQRSSNSQISIEETTTFIPGEAALATAWSADSPALQAIAVNDASHKQPSQTISVSIPHRHSEAPSYKEPAPKVKTQRLVSFPQDALPPPPAMEPAPPGGKACPRCNEPLLPWRDARFCTHCGLPFSYAQFYSSKEASKPE